MRFRERLKRWWLVRTVWIVLFGMTPLVELTPEEGGTSLCSWILTTKSVVFGPRHRGGWSRWA